MPEKETETNEKHCLECGQPLGAGRQDRKFCNDVCRTAYNNTRRKETPASHSKLPELREDETYSTRRIYDILLKNRNTLYYHTLYFGDTIALRDLVGHGFNLKFFTSEFVDDNGFVYRFCFDFGYHIHKDEVHILERPEETF